MYSVKHRQVPVVDEIPEEVLCNDKCITFLHTICNPCFVTGSVPMDWNQGIINLIPKSNNKDNRLPPNYRDITFINVHGSVYY